MQMVAQGDHNGADDPIEKGAAQDFRTELYGSFLR
jgi:hypothetical protein